MSFSTLTSAFFIRHVLYDRLEDRIEKEIERELGEFNQHIKTTRLGGDNAPVDAPADLFERFVKHEVVRDKYYLLLTKDRVYQTSDRQLASGFRFDRDSLDRLSKLARPEDGEIQLAFTSIVYYQAVPISLPSGQKGVFIVLLDATGQCEEIHQITIVTLEVSLGVFLLSAIAAWFYTKRILQPLNSLNYTLRKITDSDLSDRVIVRGDDEISHLAVTFNEMIDRLQVAFDSQKEFFNHVGHELRTLLTIVRVNLEMLSDDPQERQETIALVTDELDRMGRYVNDMILLAKSEQPDFLVLETVNLGDLTQEIYTKATALGDRNWQLEKIGKGNITCDRHRLTQVLMNLAQNAAQQTKIGDKIVIGSFLKNGKVYFWVRDAGPGIDPRVHRMIFDRFIRCPDARKRFEGMGLGLAIVKAIVEAHGGQIKLISELDRGSKFIVKMPIDPPSTTLEYLT